MSLVSLLGGDVVVNTVNRPARVAYGVVPSWHHRLDLKGRVKDIKSATAPTHINAYDYNVRVCPVLSYQAQLLPLDSQHRVLERIALHTVFRAPGTPVGIGTFLLLQTMGGQL